MLLNYRLLVLTDGHLSLVEALEVDLLLGLGQLVAVVLAGDLQLVADGHSGQVAVAGDLDDGHGLEGQHHLVRDAVLLAEGLLKKKDFYEMLSCEIRKMDKAD